MTKQRIKQREDQTESHLEIRSTKYDALLEHLTQVSMTGVSKPSTKMFTCRDGSQLLMSVTHPDSGAVTYTYNPVGTVAARVDTRNQKVVYT